MERTLVDYVTGNVVPDVGPEGSRQLFEKFLVESKGYLKSDILVDAPISVTFKGEPYHSTLDLVVCCNDTPFMAVRCIAGSLGSYEREILAGARLIYPVQIPYSVSTNGKDALVRDVITGQPAGEGLEAILTRSQAEKKLTGLTPVPLDPQKKEREMILFRSYNMEKFEDECSG